MIYKCVLHGFNMFEIDVVNYLGLDLTRKENEQQLAKLAIVTLAAGVLTLSSVDPASAAKTGGRVGGQAFRSSAPPRSSGPRINNSR